MSRMKMNRRQWLRLVGMTAAVSALPEPLRALAGRDEPPLSVRDFEKPMFDIPGQIPQPVIIESVELLKNENNYFVRTRSTDGAEGLMGTKQVADFIPPFKGLIAPYFIGKDARDIETLVDGVYRANYKLAGLPFWCPVAYTEQSLLDMLGKIAGKTVGQLLGPVVRRDIPVYLSGSDCILSAEEEVDMYVRGVAETGVDMVKFKIGGRMSANGDIYPSRTETLIRIAREKLGDGVLLAADANGSYDVASAVRIGRMLEEFGYVFFEEPCPWEHLSETQEVARRLSIPIAAGEQDSSLWRFLWMMQNGVMRIVQPDLNYNGGLIRAKRVARMAEALGLTIVPHNTQTGHNSVHILQFASCMPNASPYMEYPWRKPQEVPSWVRYDFRIRDGKIAVPETPGMGLAIDPAYIARSEVIFRVDKGQSTGTRSGSGTGNG